MTQSREVRLVRRPEGLPGKGCFEVATIAVPAPGEREILVRNLFMTVDPYMRGRMNDGDSYVAPFELGEAMQGEAIGEVVESNHPDFAVGDIVESMCGWREYFVAAPDALADEERNLFAGIQRRDPDLFPIQSYLGAAGMTGMTAYAGLVLMADPKPGETVFVSGAAGAVGSMVCQIARLHGCKVVASAGSDDKVKWLKEVAGVDAAFNYKTVDSVYGALKALTPEGIDIYFENVGGEHLTAALRRMNLHGRITVCGLIAQYNSAPERNDSDSDSDSDSDVMMTVLAKELRVEGFIVTSYYDRYPEYLDKLKAWYESGQIRWEETVVDGIENAADAFLGLFEGRNLGKMLVKL